MISKRSFVILFFVLTQALAACSGAAAEPASLPVPTSTSAPTATAEPVDPAEVVRGFWAAMEAGDVEAALAFVAEDAQCKGSCYFKGKSTFRAYLQGYINSGTVTELGELTVEGDTVRYPFKEYRNGFLTNDNATPESMQIKEGRIIFWENLHL